MAINIEWGNFNKLPQTIYDKRLDALTINPGRQRLEKMVSGMYLGELARLILSDLISKKMFLAGRLTARLAGPWKFTATDVSAAESDTSRGLIKTAKLLKSLGVKNSAYSDRLLLKRICTMVSVRSAQISAAAIAAVILWMDPAVSRKHTVAIDGSLFEKWPRYRSHISSFLRCILKEKARNISLALTPDGSGKGAAIVAATASRL
jgi:hexokinase